MHQPTNACLSYHTGRIRPRMRYEAHRAYSAANCVDDDWCQPVHTI